MDVIVQKWGNSLGIRIPGVFAKELHLKNGSHLDLKKEKNKLIITPKTKKAKLKDLLSQITDTNIHVEIETGKAVGKEIW